MDADRPPRPVRRRRPPRGRAAEVPAAERQRDGAVRGVREPDDVAEQRRARAVLRRVHGGGEDEAQEQLETADAGPGLRPVEQHVPRFAGVAQHRVHRVRDVAECVHFGGGDGDCPKKKKIPAIAFFVAM